MTENGRVYVILLYDEGAYLIFFFTFLVFSFASGLNKFCFRQETQALSIV
jgi:hypothetical protein